MKNLGFVSTDVFVMEQLCILSFEKYYLAQERIEVQTKVGYCYFFCLPMSTLYF